MMSKKFVVIFIGIFLKFHIIFSDEDCHVTQKPKLQIVFVVDQVLKANNDRWIPPLGLVVSQLLDLIKQNNFQAEYAVTGFADYPDVAGPRVITEEELCYFLMQELTADKTKIVAAITKDIFPNSVNNHSNIGTRNSDSLTTAMLFSAVEKRIKWNSGFYDQRGNLIRKIMITVAYKLNTDVLTNPGNRQPPKADGTDKCATALIPEIEHLNQVLYDHQFTVVNVLLKLATGITNIEKVYADLFASLFVPYYQVPAPVSGQNLPGNVSHFDVKAYGKTLYDIISKEVMSCDWEDPVGYNSLGL